MIFWLSNLIFVSIASTLLVCSFPKFDAGLLAWMGLVPLLLVIYNKRPIFGFIWSIISGILFFLGAFHWILVIKGYTLLHHSFLAIYLGTYFGVFGLIFCFISSRRGPGLALIAAPFIWVCLEYIRSNFSFLALPWALLGHSQYRHLPVIQIAGLVGTYGISFLIVMVNASLASLAIFLFQKGPHSHITTSQNFTFKINWPLLAISGLLTASTLIYGYIVTSRPITGESVRISMIQGNIEQTKKFDPKFADEIMHLYTSMSRKAAVSNPDLIVWPETATPKSVGRDTALRKSLLRLVDEINIPILTGSAEYQKFEKTEKKEGNYHNSAILFEPNIKTKRTQQYDKMRLFPLGEYLPYHNIIPWSHLQVPKLGRYSPGKHVNVFDLSTLKFGSTICWENIFADTVRQFVREGAECIINITNEGHFGKTAAPYQLAAISVFRAVENRIFVVRCGNTGISCVIDPYGHIIDRVKNDNGDDIFISGFLNAKIAPMKLKTIYTRYGEIAVWVSFLGIVIILYLVSFRLF